MKKCSKCKIEKDRSSFVKDKQRKDGLCLWCRECRNASGRVYVKRMRSTTEGRERRNSANAKYHHKNKNTPNGKAKAKGNLLQRYWPELSGAVALSIFNAMLAEQKNLCAICLESFANTRPCVDHCHATGRVRGLLCKPCNTALGNFNDDPELIKKAISYIKQEQEK